jgi:replicative DNA helicase
VNAQLEKVFLNYILKNKQYFEIVKPYFFKNNEIQFIFKIIQNYVTDGNKDVPTVRQIFDMVDIEDKSKFITKDIFKTIFKTDLNEYNEEDFILPKLNTWILSNKIKSGSVDIIEETRDLDNIVEFDKIVEQANKIKQIAEEMSSIAFTSDNEDLGSDFDIPENHVQDNHLLKVSSGYSTIDHMLGGGWDVGTLNCLMASTNNGKSLWMQNLAVKSADQGYNVLYITLEMSEKKVLKRLGSMGLKIPINDYDEKSKDIEFMKKKIKERKSSSSDGLFDKKVGRIITKFWAAGTATINDFDNFLKKLKEVSGIDIDLIIVDYITLIAPVKGSGGDTLYTKGKHLAEGLRALASKYNCPLITSIQVAKDAWNSNDITLQDIPESKAIAETADTFFAIIRTEDMKLQNLYRFKLLKQRDGDFLKSQVKLDLNTTYLTLENDRFIDA